MPVYVEVAVNLPGLPGLLTYHLPDELEELAQPGCLVLVTVSGRPAQAVIVRRVAEVTFRTVPVQDILDETPALTPQQIQLLETLSEESLTPPGVCLSLFLPPGVEQRAQTLYNLTAAAKRLSADGRERIQGMPARLLGLLEEQGELTANQLNRRIPWAEWRPGMQQLLRRGLVQASNSLTGTAARPRQVRNAQLAVPIEQAIEALPGLGRANTPALQRRQAMLSFLIDETRRSPEPQPVLADWLYAASRGSLADLRNLEARGLVILGEQEQIRDPVSGAAQAPSALPVLTPDQQRAWEVLTGLWEQHTRGQAPQPALIHGVTGSGKTELYLRLAAHAIDAGEQALLLVPEIALTPQMVQRVQARFPGKVGVVHSQLSAGERFDTWRRARSGDLALIVGPRSALFTPLPRLGLLVVDEFHDDSYYQSEPAPSFHAASLAVIHARQSRALCVLGSATPDLSISERLRQQGCAWLELPQRVSAIGGSGLPPVEIVDLREELKAGNTSLFSRSLQAALLHTLSMRQQAILFLNRRGSASYVFCRDCGAVVNCSRCELPLTLHGGADSLQAGRLVCHRCGNQRGVPKRCPQCQSERIRPLGAGTESVEREVQRLFPKARTLRWDRDTTRRKGAHQEILASFADGEADVLVGTQMLAKGLDLPSVTLVGVVLADVGLHLPDYRAGERLFQTLTQVAGRAGRSALGGRVILQTYAPESPSLQAAARHDVKAYLADEMHFRRRHGYPPFRRLARLEVRGRDAQKTEIAAKALAERLQRRLEEINLRQTEILGPTPAFFARLGGTYRWQVIILSPHPHELLSGVDWSGAHLQIDPPSLL